MNHRSIVDFVRVIVWPLLLMSTAIWSMLGLSPFATMCCISMSLFLLIKLHTFVEFRKTNKPSLKDSVAWFLEWPGLDANVFFDRQAARVGVSNHEVRFAIAKTCLGLLLFFVVAPRLLDWHAITAGWVALAGVVFMLHFGAFHLSALFWKANGRNVRPIMNAPILATSVGEFWSKRWNLAFRDYAHPLLFKPLARRFSPVMAIVGGYTFSGIVHELAISLPAKSGFGLPTLYFLLQGIAILLERKISKAGLNLRGGVTGWIWTLLVTVPTAVLLFHPPFIESVVIPLIEKLKRG